MTGPRLVRAIVAMAALLAAPAAEAQAPSRVPRVGFLATGTSAEGSSPRAEAWRQGLRDLGYVEGRNIAIEYRWADGRLERGPALASELVAMKVDVIVATSSPLALAARDATGAIPIVFVTAADPVTAGLVASIARPGGNVTGLSLLAPEIVARQLQILTEALPRVSRVAVLANPANAYTPGLIQATEAAALRLGVRTRVVEARGADGLDQAFAAIKRDRPGALFVLFDPAFVALRARIAMFANTNRIPAMYPHREYAEEGGLMAYGIDLRDNYRRAAAYVDKILRGARPADLPVEQPTKFELVVNLATARTVGVTFPQALLLRADEVIK